MDTPRPLEEVRLDAKRAIEARDTALMHTYASEMRQCTETEAGAYADYYDGVAYLYAGDPQTALTHLSSGRAAADALGLQHLAGVIETARGQAYMTYGQYDEALRYLDESVEAFSTLPVDRASMSARRARATVLRLMDDLAGGYEALMQVLDLARSIGDPVIEAQCLYDIGTIHMMAGELPQAFASLYTALDLYEQHGNPSDIATTLAQIAGTYGQFQDVARAKEMLHRAIDIHTSINSPLGLVDNYGNLGILHLNVGEFDDARTYLLRALEIAESIGAGHHRIFFMEALATALHGLGDSEQALAVLEREAENFRMFRDIEISSHVTRSKILLQQGHAEEANALLLADLEALEHEPRTELRLYVRDALRAVARARGDFDAYLEHDAAYNAMNEELRGKATTQKVMLAEKDRELSAMQQHHHKHLAVLYSTLPKSVADRVANGETVNDVHAHACVLFLDIAGYTTYSSEMDAQEITSMLTTIFTVFDDICAREHVVKIKTIGDSYMAVAFPEEDPSIASPEHRLANFARAMITSHFTWPNADPVRFRIGLHAGPVVAGVIGTERLQYDIWGDSVNVASRMESSGEPGRIHVSAAFAHSLNTSPPNPLSSLRGGTNIDGDDGSAVIPNEVRNEEPGTWHLAPRGFVDIKGKGAMETYWLE